jgi:hypothetical protein
MLKAKEITALSVALGYGKQAVLLQEGEEWNGLTKFRCIAPPTLHGRIIIATKNRSGNSVGAAIGAILGTTEGADWIIVMAPPDLLERIEEESK